MRTPATRRELDFADPGAGGGDPGRPGRGRGAAARLGEERLPVRHRDLAAPRGRRRQAVPAAARAAGRAVRRPSAPGRGPGRRRRRAHPPRDALPRRRHGRGVAAPRGGLARTRGGATPSRSSPATSCSPGPRTSSPTSAPRRSASRPAPSSGWCRGRSARPSGPRTATTRSEHYLQVVADKTGSLIGTSGRFGAMLSGADESATEVLTRFGERIGVAFQLSDDLLDVDRGVRSVRKDAGHRPARGRPDPAGAAPAAGRDASPTRSSSECSGVT